LYPAENFKLSYIPLVFDRANVSSTKGINDKAWFLVQNVRI
jgi:hypothetical protein